MNLRRVVSAALGTVGMLCVVAAGIGFYGESQIVDADAFAERTSAALRDENVRELIAEEVVDGLVSEASADLLVVRPLLESAITALAGTSQFRALFEFALRDAHGVLMGTRDSSVILDLDRAAVLLIDALRSISPEIAEEVPGDVEPQIARLDADDFEIDGAQALRWLGEAATTLLVLGLLAAAASVAMAARRRRALSRLGVAFAAGGVVTAVAVAILGEVVAAQAGGAADELGTTRARTSDVVGVVWENLFADLRDVALLAALGGLAFAATASGALKPGVLRDVSAAGARALRSPSPALRAARGVLAIALGVALVAVPGIVVRVATAAAGVALIAAGASTLSALVAGRRPPLPRIVARRERSPLVGQLAVGAACVLAVAVAGLAGAEMLARPTGAAKAAPPPPPGGCNGARELCDRRLNEVVFPATHNSFSAADESGWLFANQRYGIERQLTDGIRGLLLDVHVGVRDARTGRVRTDIAAEGTDRNRVAKRLDAEALRVADRVAGGVGLGDLEGRRELYLCHTLCELGAEPLARTLATVHDFLETHPNEVLVLLFEPFVPAADIERAVDDAGLLEQAATLRRDEPLPTLGELVEQERRLVVFTERGSGGRPWYHDAYTYMQATPLGAEKPADFTCARSRGSADSPLLALYHWVDRFPPQPSANGAIAGDFLRKRAERCAEERGLVPNLLAVDFYDRSDVIDVARTLNRGG